MISSRHCTLLGRAEIISGNFQSILQVHHDTSICCYYDVPWHNSALWPTVEHRCERSKEVGCCRLYKSRRDFLREREWSVEDVFVRARAIMRTFSFSPTHRTFFSYFYTMFIKLLRSEWECCEKILHTIPPHTTASCSRDIPRRILKSAENCFPSSVECNFSSFIHFDGTLILSRAFHGECFYFRTLNNVTVSNWILHTGQDDGSE